MCCQQPNEIIAAVGSAACDKNDILDQEHYDVSHRFSMQSQTNSKRVSLLSTTEIE